ILLLLIFMIFVLTQSQRMVAQNTTTLSDLQKAQTNNNEFSTQAIDTLIQYLINQTNLDTLIYFVNILSGEDSVTINDSTYLFLSRYLYHPHNDLAADFIFQTLTRFNIPTYNQNYSSTGRNVYSIKTGTDYPDQKFIICAHYDDMPAQPPAPGADDNAGSVAAVLEAARILSQIPTPYTIIFALWDEEERGLWGSRYYALQSYLSGDDILGVVNLEMLGWDSDDDGLFDINTRPIANSVELANLVDSLANLYNLGLTSAIFNPGTTYSDHSSFWDYGYSAMVFSEAFFSGDGNPYYHTSNDKIEHFNLAYYHALAKLAVATITHLAFYNFIPVGIRNETNDLAVDFVLEQNYPNPFNPITSMQYTTGSRQFVTLKVYDLLGNEIATLVNEEKPAGTYELTWNAEGLPSGVYFYQLRAGNFVETKKMVFMK
ncbi:MAG: M20/M25/M40 family metallo-hydrolase, partial [Ignavibacteriaceae bacterium]